MTTNTMSALTVLLFQFACTRAAIEVGRTCKVTDGKGKSIVTTIRLQDLQKGQLCRAILTQKQLQKFAQDEEKVPSNVGYRGKETKTFVCKVLNIDRRGIRCQVEAIWTRAEPSCWERCFPRCYVAQAKKVPLNVDLTLNVPSNKVDEVIHVDIEDIYTRLLVEGFKQLNPVEKHETVDERVIGFVHKNYNDELESLDERKFKNAIKKAHKELTDGVSQKKVAPLFLWEFHNASLRPKGSRSDQFERIKSALDELVEPIGEQDQGKIHSAILKCLRNDRDADAWDRVVLAFSIAWYKIYQKETLHSNEAKTILESFWKRYSEHDMVTCCHCWESCCAKCEAGCDNCAGNCNRRIDEILAVLRQNVRDSYL